MAERTTTETLDVLERAGLLVLFVSDAAPDWDLPEDDDAAVNFVVSMLEETGVLLPAESLTGGEGI